MLYKIFMIILISLADFYAQDYNGTDILKMIDENITVKSAVIKAKMIIQSRTGTRTIEFKSCIDGQEKSFVEYTSPARDKGKKMLKLGEKIWNYVPEPADRIISISGHLLRQSVMGSDLSYEDMTENRKLYDLYNVTKIVPDTLDGKDVLRLELVSKEENINYYSRKIWINQEIFLPLKEELYARSGKLLKITEIKDYKKIEGQYYPVYMKFKDVLQKGGGTEYIIDTIDLNVVLPASMFTKAALRR